MNKKIISLMFGIIVLLGGCAKENEELISSEGCLVQFALISDQEENPISLQVFQGIEELIKEYEIKDECYTQLQVADDSEYLPYITQFAEQGYQLIILPTFKFNAKQEKIASIYSNTAFLAFDTTSDLDNVIGIDFKDEQAAFLAGISASLKAKELGGNTVGFIGGEMNDLSNRIQAGFEQGVFEIDSEMNILINYIENLDDEISVEEVAYRQFEAGATVIYHTALMDSAKAINEDEERNIVYVVDDYSNQNQAENSSVILASTLKDYKNATYQIVEAMLNHKEIDLDDFCAEFELNREEPFSKDIQDKLEEYKKQLKNETIEIDTVPQVAIYNFIEPED